MVRRLAAPTACRERGEPRQARNAGSKNKLAHRLVVAEVAELAGAVRHCLLAVEPIALLCIAASVSRAGRKATPRRPARTMRYHSCSASSVGGNPVARRKGASCVDTWQGRNAPSLRRRVASSSCALPDLRCWSSLRALA